MARMREVATRIWCAGPGSQPVGAVQLTPPAWLVGGAGVAGPKDVGRIGVCWGAALFASGALTFCLQATWPISAASKASVTACHVDPILVCMVLCVPPRQDTKYRQ